MRRGSVRCLDPAVRFTLPSGVPSIALLLLPNVVYS